jgi:hypothetical protein
MRNEMESAVSFNNKASALWSSFEVIYNVKSHVFKLITYKFRQSIYTNINFAFLVCDHSE